MKFIYDSTNKLDAGENAFLRRELESVAVEVHETEYPQLKARSLIPVSHATNTGAEMETWQTQDGVGKSAIAKGYSGKAPRVDVALTDESQRIVGLVDSYGYSFQEARNGALVGRSLEAQRALVAREVIETDLDSLMLLGNSAEGLDGLFNLASALTYAVPNGTVSAAPEWEGKLSSEILIDLNAMVSQIRLNSKGIEAPNVLALPISSMALISERSAGNNTDTTILKYFLANNGFIKEVVDSHYLEDIGGAKRACAFSRDKTRLEASVPQEFEQFAPQHESFETVINCHARYGGLKVYRPKSVILASNI